MFSYISISFNENNYATYYSLLLIDIISPSMKVLSQIRLLLNLLLYEYHGGCLRNLGTTGPSRLLEFTYPHGSLVGFVVLMVYVFCVYIFFLVVAVVVLVSSPCVACYLCLWIFHSVFSIVYIQSFCIFYYFFYFTNVMRGAWNVP